MIPYPCLKFSNKLSGPWCSFEFVPSKIFGMFSCIVKSKIFVKPAKYKFAIYEDTFLYFDINHFVPLLMYLTYKMYSPCKHAIMCQNWTGIGPMLAALGHFRPCSGTLWHAYRVLTLPSTYGSYVFNLVNKLLLYALLMPYLYIVMYRLYWILYNKLHFNQIYFWSKWYMCCLFDCIPC